MKFLKPVLRYVIWTLALAACLFISSGRLDWLMAWAYLGATVTFQLVGVAIMLKFNPEVIKERAKLKTMDIKDWDKKILPLVFLVQMVVLVAAGLDMRFGWSPQIPLNFQIAALAISILGYLPGAWAMAVNKYYEAVVRIQKERGHKTITIGPYKYIRHPGYAGIIITYPATPIALGSFVALIPATLQAALIILRTSLEDKTLQKELRGYREYTEKTRYRLLPGVW